MYKLQKVSILFVIIVIFSCIRIYAQQIININDENRTSIHQKAVDLTIDSTFKKAENYRQFFYNPKLQDLSSYNEGDTLLLNFFDNKTYKAVIKKATASRDGIIGITAQISGSHSGYCYISISENGISIISELPMQNEQYFISTINGKTYLSQYKMSEIQKDILEDIALTIPEKDSEAILKKEVFSSECTDHINDVVTIDVMCVYTKAAAQWATVNPTVTDIDHVIDMAIQRSNEAMDNSLTGIRFNLVHKHQTDYTEVNNQDDLDRLVKENDGYLDEVHVLRQQYKADLIVFIPKVDFTGGLAYVLNNENGNRDWCSFSLCRVQQAASSYTAVHEIGHNMGCHHHKDQNFQPGPGLFHNSSGWRGTTPDNSAYCTIMTYEHGSYFSDNITHYRIPYFSSPDIIYKGIPIGNAVSNNALTLRQTKHVTSRYETKSNIRLNIDNYQKISGNPDPVFTYELICGELSNDKQVILERDAGEISGDYNISAKIYHNGTDITDQYHLLYPMSTLKIEPKCVIHSTDQDSIYQDSYFIWQGIRFNTDRPGIVTESKTLLASSGCDSVVTFILTVKAIPKIIIEQTDYSFCSDSHSGIITIDYTPVTKIKSLIITFNNYAIQQGFTNITYNYTPNNKFTINIPDGVESGTYALWIKPVNEEGHEGIETRIYLKSNQSSEGIIIQKWNNVLACDNKEKDYIAYQWYINGTAIPSATEQFYYVVNNFDALYHVIITTKSGETIETCPVQLKPQNKQTESSLLLFPNPVNPGSQVTLKTELYNEYDLKDANVAIYNSTGGLETSFKITTKTVTLNAPNKAGVYIVVLHSRYGARTLRMLVK